MVKVFIGIDGGGTKTDVICADESGKIIGTGSSGPTNLTSTTVGAASFNLKEAIRQALETIPEDREFGGVAMGLAGMDTEHEYEIAHKTFLEILAQFKITNLVLVNDSLVALINGTDNPNAVILISGTGSICLGRNAAGSSAKTGGMDHLLTDQGSGHDIGRHVLREAVKSFDGRRPKTILEELVCKHFSVASIDHLKTEVYNPVLSKVEIAELAQVCSVAYEQGDEAAKEIFSWAERELLLLTTTVLKELGLQTVTVDMVISGAVLGIPHVREHLKEELCKQFSQLHFISPDKPPVYGALKMAMQQR